MRRGVDATSRRDINRKIFRRIQTRERTIRSREDDLGLLDPTLRAAAFAPLRARFNLDLAQTKRLPRDVVLDLLFY